MLIFQWTVYGANGFQFKLICIFYILSFIPQVMEILFIGGLIGGFIQQTKELGKQHLVLSPELVLEECTQLLARFRGLKKGFESLLFILFSTNIIIVTVTTYFLFLGMADFMLSVPTITMIMVPIMLLIYAALLADDGFTALKDLLTALR